MIQADVIRDGEDEPTWSLVLDQAPAVGDQIHVNDGLAPAYVTFEILRRQWYADPNRPSPNNVVTLYVREVAE